MLREYQLENFKAFAGPETMPIRPITLIYGPNSSGKSSILQSLLMLKQTLEEADSSTSLLPKGKLVDLGSYQEFVHRHELKRSFSFKALFTPDYYPLDKVDKEGLKVDFVYDEETSVAKVRSLTVFSGDENLLVYAGFPFLDVDSLTFTTINRTHDYWRDWWTSTKESTERAVDNAEYVSYYKDLEKEPFENFLQDLKDYPFEKALTDLAMANKGSSIDDLQNFLPIRMKCLSYDNMRRFYKKLDEIWGRELSSPISVEALFSEKQSTEECSPFRVEIIYVPFDGRGPFEQKLDVSPITLQVCSAFRQLVKKMIYLGPLRNSPERYYTFSGNLSEQVGQFGERMPDVLFRNREVVERVNAEFDRFQLGYKLELSELIHKDSEPSNVFALGLVDKNTGVSASIRDVGFGVSQVLPIIVQSLLSQNKTLLIEQPEIHLHPALQAELGDLFIKSALGEQKNTFILETHSEHLLLRILRRIRETTEGELEPGLIPIRPEDVAVLYVLPDKDGAKVMEIPIRPDGEFAKRWPQGFFAERAKELF